MMLIEAVVRGQSSGSGPWLRGTALGWRSQSIVPFAGCQS